METSVSDHLCLTFFLHIPQTCAMHPSMNFPRLSRVRSLTFSDKPRAQHFYFDNPNWSRKPPCGPNSYGQIPIIAPVQCAQSRISSLEASCRLITIIKPVSQRAAVLAARNFQHLLTFITFFLSTLQASGCLRC